MKYIHYIIGLLALAACSQAVNDPLEPALSAMRSHDYEAAVEAIEQLDVDTTTTLDVAQLGRLSIIYMKLSEVKDVDVNTAMATRCYTTAMWIDADSARSFYNSLPIDESQYVEVMQQLNGIISTPISYYLDEPMTGEDDSIDISNPDTDGDGNS